MITTTSRNGKCINVFIKRNKVKSRIQSVLRKPSGYLITDDVSFKLLSSHLVEINISVNCGEAVIVEFLL